MSAPLDLIASDDDAPAVVVKRFRRSRQPSSDAQQSTADSSDNSFVVIAEDTHIAPSSKGGPSTPPPCIAQGRLSEPKHRVSQQKGVGKIRPKLPALHSGSWPLPVLPPRAPPLPQGDSLGHPVPPPKATPRSLLFRPPDEPRPSSTVHSWSVKDWFADPSHALKTYKPVILPSEAPAMVFTTSRNAWRNAQLGFAAACAGQQMHQRCTCNCNVVQPQKHMFSKSWRISRQAH